MAKSKPTKARRMEIEAIARRQNLDIFLVSKDEKRITVKVPEGSPGRFLLMLRPDGTAGSNLSAESRDALLLLIYCSLQMGLMAGLQKVDKELYAFCTAMRNQMREMWPQLFLEETKH